MKIDSSTFEKMAKFNLAVDEHEWIMAQLDMLTEDFSLLNSMDTTDIEPLVTVLPMTNVFREDICEKKFERTTILANAPEQYDGYFQVPKTFE
jgi:aspartyl-tRNA(Asn)/glutamyl-tRNA(Gln) amidotransferase subunit C